MNYATWKLNFTNPEYGTGPEDKIAELGYGAEGAWVAGQAENGGTILGYVTEPQDESQLTAWNFTNITEAEALAFCSAINSNAYLLPDGTITRPRDEITS
jgi:malate synthase